MGFTLSSEHHKAHVLTFPSYTQLFLCLLNLLPWVSTAYLLLSVLCVRKFSLSQLLATSEAQNTGNYLKGYSLNYPKDSP